MDRLPHQYKQEIDYSEFHKTFAESEFGEALRNSIRFERFKPEHLTDEDWSQLLGHDVNGLKHMSVLYGMTRVFLAECREAAADDSEFSFTAEQEEILLLAAITNNWGEIETGNIAYDQKTTEKDMQEKDAFREVFNSLFGETVDVKLRMLVERTVFDKHTNIGQAFDAIQKVSYLRIGLLAYKEAEQTDDPIIRDRLRWLCANVLSNQMLMLVEYSNTYPPIRNFLDSQHSLISEAFESLDPSIFSVHGQNESMRTELFWQNKRSWYEFNRYEVEDLRNEIITTALEAITDKSTADQVKTELNTLLDTYKRVLSGGLSNGENTETFDKGLFGPTSNFEARFVPDHEMLKKKLEAIRELGLKVVLTSGSFDLLHIGHAGYLEKAKQYGDVLVVGVDDDTKMKRKGPDRPMIPESERTRLLTYLRSVDIVTLKGAHEEKWGLIRLVNPDTLITTQETYTEKEIARLHKHCGRVIVLPPQATTSTSARIRRMNLGFGEKFLRRAELSIDQLIRDSAELPPAELRAQIYAVMEAALEDVIANE